ncbi:hypothetical protein CWE09_11320 [Aliidiomarina minuta]|uniref:Tyr recombinase domain-containing protein n=1 Tax=Aliidiomarina minuta TaxID=880057 RepID=A0A432W4N1_9GAMM|nr:tyrosine-type recombinase/integrase [Aliidiomarina minuta]RUO24445.1 hypothetical protein CWE09_11320 [Aliidiomarina minuta]
MSFYSDYLCAPRGNKPALRNDNPYEDGLISGAAKSRLVEMCSVDELIALLESSDSERERALLQFMYDSGVRRSEVCKINRQQFKDSLDFERRSVIIDDRTLQIPGVYKPFYVAGVKGRRRETKERNTVVSETSLVRVKRYHSSPLYRKSIKKYGNNGPAFLNAEGNPYTPSSISKLLRLKPASKGLISQERWVRLPTLDSMKIFRPTFFISNYNPIIHDLLPTHTKKSNNKHTTARPPANGCAYKINAYKPIIAPPPITVILSTQTIKSFKGSQFCE